MRHLQRNYRTLLFFVKLLLQHTQQKQTTPSYSNLNEVKPCSAEYYVNYTPP